MAYSDNVLDHYENPRNVGSFEKGDDAVGTGMVGAPAKIHCSILAEDAIKAAIADYKSKH